jgi:ABC-type multidrug transport system ATPase subunit
VLDLIRTLKSEKIAIILISHRLTDVFAVCDRIIALRQGTVVADEPIGKTSIRAAFTIVAPVDYLDLATVIRVSQAISGEIVLEKLIDTLMRTAIERAGAERGILILPQGGNYWIEAEARAQDDEVTVDLRQMLIPLTQVPLDVVSEAERA